ncbi:MAG: SGNH/GDSL hydrolase family protein [Bacilli bacterium]
MGKKMGNRWIAVALTVTAALVVAAFALRGHMGQGQVFNANLGPSNTAFTGAQSAGGGMPTIANRKTALVMFHSWRWNAPVRVDVFGGSIAAGWVDTKGGYISRALRGWAQQSHVHVALEHRADPGMSIMQMGSRFSAVIAQTRPNWVILSWGGLNDAVDHTSVSAFQQALRTEIQTALKGGAQLVWVVTPPVTAAAAINGPHATPDLYFEAEQSVVGSLHDSRVVMCPVYSQMMSWLQQHGQNYQPYQANGWHPNAKGHALAGRLLLEDMKFLLPPLQVRKGLSVKRV